VCLILIATIRWHIYFQQLQVVAQGLSGGNEVNGSQMLDDLIHEGSVLHPIKGVLVLVGE
jgi:hypothetical protein